MFRGSNHHESAMQGMLNSNAGMTRAVGVYALPHMYIKDRSNKLSMGRDCM